MPARYRDRNEVVGNLHPGQALYAEPIVDTIPAGRSYTYEEELARIRAFNFATTPGLPTAPLHSNPDRFGEPNGRLTAHRPTTPARSAGRPSPTGVGCGIRWSTITVARSENCRSSLRTTSSLRPASAGITHLASWNSGGRTGGRMKARGAAWETARPAPIPWTSWLTSGNAIVGPRPCGYPVYFCASSRWRHEVRAEV